HAPGISLTSHHAVSHFPDAGTGFPEEGGSGMSASGGLEEWAERFGRCRPGFPPRGRQRFAFYGRVSTEDWQDPVTSRARQRDQALALVAGHGAVLAECFARGEAR